MKLETHFNKFRYSTFYHKINSFRFHRLLEFHFGAGAYAVSRKGASLIISELEKCDLPVDDVIFHRMVLCKKYGTALQLNPACCIQEKHTCEGLNDESDIRSSRLERIDNLRKPKSRKF